MFERINLSSSRGNRAIGLLSLAIVVALSFAGAAMTQTKKAPAKPSSTTSAQKKAASNTKTVTIKCNGTITVTPRSVTILEKTEQVLWTDNDKCSGWTVNFDKPEGSPFTPKDRFDHGNDTSGTATVHAHKYGYRYTVSVPNLPDLDPDVIIKGSGASTPKH